jgi:hypothetical protein
LKFSDLSISSMLCAVALSSSINKTRMSGPQPCPSVRDRGVARRKNAAEKPTPNRKRNRSIQNAKLTTIG